MGRNSSGVRGGLQPGDGNYKGKIAKVEDLVKMKDPAMYKATGEAISRYHSVMGVRQKKVKLAELSEGTLGMYEPIHGSAPDIAGTGKANPIATILSAAMMLRYSFNLQTEADRIENAVDAVLNAGWRTADIVGDSGVQPLTCDQMTDKIIEEMRK